MKSSIFNKGQDRKLAVRFKGFLNLSWKMKFVLDFCHSLALAQSVTKFMVQDKFKNPLNLTQHWKSKTNKKRVLEIWDKFVSDHEICTRFLPYLALAQSITKFMVRDKFVSDFQCSFFCLGPFDANHH